MAATLNQPTLGGKDQPTLLLTANGLCGATKSAADDTPPACLKLPCGIELLQIQLLSHRA
jgi:hypothetical protein